MPCYKEDLEVVSATVRAALDADLPAGVQRTVYICDDGKDDRKKAFAKQMGDEVVYVTGRVRQKGRHTESMPQSCSSDMLQAQCDEVHSLPAWQLRGAMITADSAS